MKEMPRRLFPFQYSPGKKLFHIVVKISDAPGSLSAILNLLGPKVNLIGTGTYTLDDGTAMFTAFAESLEKDQTPKSVQELVLGSKAAIEVQVSESKDGVLVDTFHNGIVVGKQDYMMFRREGLSQMFDQVSKILGSGGEALLYEEGFTIGQKNAQQMIDLIGIEQVRSKSQYLSHFLAAQGWGEIEPGDLKTKGPIHVKIKNCFECAKNSSARTGCNFLRGYFSGSAASTYQGNFETQEVRCVMKGSPYCEFSIKPVS